jgi:hypothetical protein
MPQCVASSRLRLGIGEVGGKLIQYAGWADTAIAPENGLNYYRNVTSVMGDVHGFYRVFVSSPSAKAAGWRSFCASNARRSRRPEPIRCVIDTANDRHGHLIG